MTLSNGCHDVPAGKLAAVVTSLEMFAKPERRPEPAAAAWQFRHVETPQSGWYRELFRRVGEEYLWTARLTLSDDALRALLDDPLVEVYSLVAGGNDEGLVELDFRVPDVCELAVFGITSAMLGRGAGRWLMNRVLERVWAQPLQRFWVHTCTLDHEAALGFYMHSGFQPFKREVEILDDPRRDGLVSPDAARQIPLLS
jgi:GNAT superfamily N-acetyltransferase